MNWVNIIHITDINIISFFILLLLLFTTRNRQVYEIIQRRLFRLLVMANMLMLMMDILGWSFDAAVGAPVSERLPNLLANLGLFAPAPIPAALWFLYAHWHIFHDPVRLKRTARILAVPIILNVVLTILTIRTGWYFSINEQNFYVRGPYYWIHILISFSFPIAAMLMVVICRRLLVKRDFWGLLLFAVPQLTGALLQVAFFGLSLTWSSMMVSILIAYLSIQDRGLNTDNLTGTCNRRHFEQIIGSRIRRIGDGRPFAVILCDMDRFKCINDSYGHLAGDEALQRTAQVLRGVLRKEDLIARLGGDEFYLLLELPDETGLAAAIQRIYAAFGQFNQASRLPYRLELSAGGALYDPHGNQSADEFLRQVDRRMYEEKNRRRLHAASGPLQAVHTLPD